MNQFSTDAMNRYLKDLKQALDAAPKTAKEDALRDAAEFLSNEISSTDAKQMATSEQQAYDHFIECYGSPSQVAVEYLQALETSSHKVNVSKRCNIFAMAFIILIGIAGITCFAMFREPPKLSPFTQVDFEGDKIIVEFNEMPFEWIAIDDILVSDIIASSKKQFHQRWQKRIAEDLVEVLWGMGHSPGATVKLRLRKDTTTTTTKAPMTLANRWSVYEARKAGE